MRHCISYGKLRKISHYRPARGTVAFPGQGAAGSAVLTTALRLALFAVLAYRTQVVASA